MKAIELKDLRDQKIDDVYNPINYKLTGIYCVVSVGENIIVSYNTIDKAVYYLGRLEAYDSALINMVDPEITKEAEAKLEVQEGSVSEKFALKMLAIATGNQEVKDLTE